jgi:hypothetical protein
VPASRSAGVAARRSSLTRPDLPFPSDISAERADALLERLGHHAFV